MTLIWRTDFFRGFLLKWCVIKTSYQPTWTCLCAGISPATDWWPSPQISFSYWRICCSCELCLHKYVHEYAVVSTRIALWMHYWWVIIIVFSVISQLLCTHLSSDPMCTNFIWPACKENTPARERANFKTISMCCNHIYIDVYWA